LKRPAGLEAVSGEAEPAARVGLAAWARGATLGADSRLAADFEARSPSQQSEPATKLTKSHVNNRQRIKQFN